LLRQIRLRTQQNPSGGVRLGIGDDCALLRVRSGEEMAVTTDLSIEGRHFELGWHPAESVGHRTLARGLSDLAAMGARPVAAFLSLGVPKALTERTGGGRTASSWVERFFDGLMALAAELNVPLAGGDLAESKLAVADIVLIGAVPRGRALLRSAARVGDRLFVTGTLGGADVGLACLRQLAAAGTLNPRRIPKRFSATLAAHLYPQPRIGQGIALRGLAHGCMDMSDGLSTDLAHLCDESGVGAEVDAAALPLAAGATLADGLHGGDDYQLLFTAAPRTRIPAAIAGVPVTQIGRIVARPAMAHSVDGVKTTLRMARRSSQQIPAQITPQITLIGPDGRTPLERQGWEHFS